jgi:hypothetical protein
MLTIPNFYADQTLIVLYSGITLPDGSQASAACSVELGLRNASTGALATATASVVVSGSLATASITIAAGALAPALHRWRTTLVDGLGNRIPLDEGEVKVESF